MSVLKNLRVLARYEVLTPMVVLAAMAASPAMAQTLTINAPETMGVFLDGYPGGPYNALINNSSITNAANNTAAGSPNAVVSITNSITGSVIGDADNAFGFASTVGTFTNNGLISNGGQFSAINFNGAVGTFTNTKTITSTSGGAVNFNGAVGTFTNSGAMSGTGYNAAFFRSGVNSFTNAAGGTITNTDATQVNPGDFGGSALGFQTDTVVGGTVDSFINAGTITAAPNQTPGQLRATVAFFQSGNGAFQVGSFLNTGNITGRGTGVAFDGGVASFSNSGGITSTEDRGIFSGGPVGSFTNSGTITAANQGVVFNGIVTDFTNLAGGTISSTGGQNAVYFDAAVTNFTNGGSIFSSVANDYSLRFSSTVANFSNLSGAVIDGGMAISGLTQNFVNGGTIRTSIAHAVELNGATTVVNTGTIVTTDLGNSGLIAFGGHIGTLTNSGTISGGGGVTLNGGGGIDNLINSGVLKGTLYAFQSNGAFGDKVTVLTGSEVYGALNFGGGNDTFDFSGFYGSAVVQVSGLETIVAGDRPYAILANNGVPGDLQAGAGIAIYDPSGATSMGSITSDIIGGIQGAITDGLSNTFSFTEETSESAFVAPRQPTSAEAATEAAVLSELDVGQASGGQVWGKVFGGISTDNAPVALSNIYGGIVAGSHFQLDAQTRLGGLGGYARSSFNVANGQQVITSDTGVLGVYGSSDLGVLDVTYSLLGGASGHSSTRKVVVGAVLETATASFSSWFLAPSLGVSVPVLSDDTTKVNVAATASYIFGGVSGYTETVSGGNGTVTVGGQSIGVFDARLELNGAKVVGSTERGDVTIRGKIGVMLQANAGGSAMPISFANGAFTGTTSFTAPGSTTVGAYAGMGLSAELTDNLDFDVSADGSARSDGTIALSAKAGLTGSF